MQSSALSLAAPMPSSESASTAAPAPRLPYTPRASLSFLVILAAVAVGLHLARVLILPAHPNLLPLTILLPAYIALCAHHTLLRTSLPAYHLALRALLSSSPSPHRVPTPPPRCAKCDALRPPRTHHCRICGRCTPRMSHHCAVLGVCVGAHNQKPFVLLLLSGAVSASLVAAHTQPEFWRRLHLLFAARSLPASVSAAVMLQAMHAMLGLAVVLWAGVLFHVALAARGWTVLEASVRKMPCYALLCPSRSPTSLAAPSPQSSPPRSPYAAGLARNLCDALGAPLVAAVWPPVDARERARAALSYPVERATQTRVAPPPAARV